MAGYLQSERIFSWTIASDTRNIKQDPVGPVGNGDTMIRLFPLLSAVMILSACASIDLNKVEIEKLEADITLLQTLRHTQVDLYLSRGLFNQPVSLGDARAEIERGDGRRTALQPSRKSGRYGLREESTRAPRELFLESVGSVEFPRMSRVELIGKDSIADQRFYKDDVITLNVPESLADARYIVATAWCGNQQFTSEQKIAINDNEITLTVGRLMDRLNHAAEADLNGVIPVEFAIEERYTPRWPAPFAAKSLAARDHTQFSVDTSGFRFQAKVRVQVSGQLFLSFQNQAWPVRYCF